MITMVMRTFNRHESTAPLGPCFTRENYLGYTLRSMVRGGVFKTPTLHSFHLVDSGSKDATFFDTEVPAGLPILLHLTPHKRTPNLNAAYALGVGALTPSEWVLFCEDDIEVCADFVDGVQAWLDRNAREDRRLYTFGSNNSDVRNGAEMNDVTVECFYGTTCYALRQVDAASMARYIEGNPNYTGGRFLGHEGVPVAHDLHYHQWSRLHYPTIDFFAAAAPSHVQHIGNASGISAREHTISYPSWGGKDWTYRG